jgi:hypothetical protein
MVCASMSSVAMLPWPPSASILSLDVCGNVGADNRDPRDGLGYKKQVDEYKKQVLDRRAWRDAQLA